MINCKDNLTFRHPGYSSIHSSPRRANLLSPSDAFVREILTANITLQLFEWYAIYELESFGFRSVKIKHGVSAQHPSTTSAERVLRSGDS